MDVVQHLMSLHRQRFELPKPVVLYCTKMHAALRLSAPRKILMHKSSFDKSTQIRSKTCHVIKGLPCEVATPYDVRAILELKGTNPVAFL